ncbi:MAG: PAS-domain containing protein, partial [Candidatus Competibacteraceae bacterium]|nr:PAS-domain containing protein [Candidatus Competibacteraceae bacterium]
WEMDADLRFTYFSDRVGEVLDVDPLSLLGKSRVDLSVGSGDDDRESMEHHLQSIHRREPFRDFVYELEDSTGRKRTVRVNGVPVFSATGDFQGYRGTGTDITRETEAAARAEKARAQLIDAIESVSEGFVLWDADDKLVVVNNQYRKTFPSLTGVMRVGESFESILREGVRQKLYTVADGDLNAWM